AVEHLDDDALQPQVVAPDPLDQLGVVTAFDPDPGGARDARAGVRDRDRAGRGARRAGRRRGARARRHQPHRLAVDPEPRTEPERARAALAVLEHDDVLAAALLDTDHGPDPAGLDVLDHQTPLCGDVGGLRAPGAVRVVAEDIGAVAVVTHAARRYARRARNRGRRRDRD